METKKKLSFWHIWALGVGAVVGDGIFLMVAQAGQAAGPAATVAYFLAGLLIMLICMSVCELAVGMPKAGSIYHWSRRVISPAFGTLTGLCYVAMNAIFLGSVGIAAGQITNSFFQIGSNEQLSATIWTLIILTVVLGIALLGGEITGRAQLILVAALVGIMLVFIVLGLFSGRIDAANLRPPRRHRDLRGHGHGRVRLPGPPIPAHRRRRGQGHPLLPQGHVLGLRHLYPDLHSGHLRPGGPGGFQPVQHHGVPLHHRRHLRIW